MDLNKSIDGNVLQELIKNIDKDYIKKEELAKQKSPFIEWLKSRNYNLQNFKALENIFPELTFPELKITSLQIGDTTIAGTGAPNTWVVYKDKKIQIPDDGKFAFKGLQPLQDKERISISCIDYAGRQHTQIFCVNKITYAVPDEITEITSNEVSKYNLNRAEMLIFPNSVREIDYRAFSACKNLTAIELPGCTHIGDSAFANCHNLTIINLPVCEDIEDNAFLNTKVTRVDLPMCRRIGDSAFSDCGDLTTINLPVCEKILDRGFNSTKIIKADLPMCKKIGDEGLSECDELIAVNLPICEEIGKYGFIYCDKLKELVVSEKISIDSIKRAAIPKSCVIYNNTKTKKLNRNTWQWENI